MIEVVNLEKSFGENKVLKGITETIATGEVVSVIGPSGSGKSTFLRCLNLLEMPTGGKIVVDDEEITAKNTDINKMREKIGMVFQRFNLFPHKTVLENITLAPVHVKKIPLEDAKKRAMELLSQVGLANKADSYPQELSGGQQQRVCIARVLAVNPEIILMDEPTSALDPISAARVEETMLELKKDYTIAIVTHSMQQASRISDRTAFMLDGNLIEYNDTKSIFLNPEKQETSDYISGKFG